MTAPAGLDPAARIAIALPSTDLSPLDGRRVLLDCRWLGIGGAGRATEHLLRGLAELRPPGEWLLWGPRAGDHTWPGARPIVAGHSPLALMGQRDYRAVPSRDLAIYMHQIRPLRRGRSLTLIHDTIPLRHGGSKPKRFAKKAFYMAAASLSTGVLTVSQYSARTIVRDTRTTRNKIRVLRYPVDAALVERVLERRRSMLSVAQALYVGRFDDHKNLHRLILAFARTRLRAHGGTLRLVGGGVQETMDLRAFAARHGITGVAVSGTCSDDELVGLYAESAVLVMPSLEEGFGLPAWEALSCGLPVAASHRGSLPEVVGTAGYLFDPLSLDGMAAAIDDACEGGPREFDVSRAPTAADFAGEVVVAAAAVIKDVAR